MAWLSNYSKRKVLTLTGGASGAQTNFQLKLTVSKESAMQGDFDDIRFTQVDGETLIDAWAEVIVTDTSATVWVEFPTTPANTVEQTYYMYYGNSGAASDWSGDNTFLQYHGAATAQFLDALTVSPTNVAWEGKIKRIGTVNVLWGLANTITSHTDDCMTVQANTGADLRYLSAVNEGTNSNVSEAPNFSDDTWVHGKMTNDGTTLRGYIDDNEIGAGVTTNLPNENLGLNMWEPTGTAEQDWSFARKYVANPPTYAFGSERSPFISTIIIM